MSGKDAPVVDSRRWTGPEPARPTLDPRASRAAFRAVGGAGAVALQRVASAVSWIGLGLMVPVVLVGATRDTWLLGLQPLAGRVRAGLEGWLAVVLAPDSTGGVAGRIGDPRILAALLALVGTLAGSVAAGRHRAALARGFAAAEAGGPPGAASPPSAIGASLR